MKLLSTLIVLHTVFFASAYAEENRAAGYTGSASCKECHEKFHQLWSTSRHGLAMQPYTRELAQKEILPQDKEIKIGTNEYRAEIHGTAGYITEIRPEGERKYRIEYVLGGKNVYY